MMRNFGGGFVSKMSGHNIYEKSINSIPTNSYCRNEKI